MVGEIRDSETADIAIKASLTGQMVLSTLHTNDAAGAITRLIDMGVEPFLIASSLILAAAQRLCRRICFHCKEPYQIPYSVLEKAGVKLPKSEVEKMTFYHGKGCRQCNQSGYLGRMGILETLVIDDEIRHMIVARVSSNDIKDYAVKKGMLTLRENGLHNFMRGDTTLEEVLRVTSEE
jgi:type IV pilus assembly protein PilB